MSTQSPNQYARDCVQLAQRTDLPELRQELLKMARESMREGMEDDKLAAQPPLKRQVKEPTGKWLDQIVARPATIPAGSAKPTPIVPSAVSDRK